MVKQIVRDPLFLAQKSEPATEADRQVIEDFTAQIIQHEIQHFNGELI